MAKRSADNPHVTCPKCRASLTIDPLVGAALVDESQAKLGSNGEGRVQPASSAAAATRRHTEMEWLIRNTAQPGPYEGKWVVVEKDQLIASDVEYAKARAEALRRGITIPFIVFVPPADEAEFMGI